MQKLKLIMLLSIAECIILLSLPQYAYDEILCV